LTVKYESRDCAGHWVDASLNAVKDLPGSDSAVVDTSVCDTSSVSTSSTAASIIDTTTSSSSSKTNAGSHCAFIGNVIFGKTHCGMILIQITEDVSV